MLQIVNLTVLLQQVIFYGAVATSIILFIAFVLIWRFGGIRTWVLYVERGNTLRLVHAHEDEKSVWFGDKTFSKVVLKKDGTPDEEKTGKGDEKKYKPAAEPAVMWRRGRPARVFRCQEGYPVILPHQHDLPVTDISADDLNALSRGAFAKGLAKMLLKAAGLSLTLSIVLFLFGLVTGMFLYPIIFP